jgi:hypothetical protein
MDTTLCVDSQRRCSSGYQTFLDLSALLFTMIGQLQLVWAQMARAVLRTLPNICKFFAPAPFTCYAIAVVLFGCKACGPADEL